MRKHLLLGLALLAIVATRTFAEPTVRLERVGEYVTGNGRGDEIVSVQSPTRRAVLGNSVRGTVDLVELSHPEAPVRLARFDLKLAKRETLTSVAFHPTRNVFVAAIQAAGPLSPGRLEIRSAADGTLAGRFEAGVGPDCVSIDPTGRFAMSANEGEPFVFIPETRRFVSAPGSLTLIRFGATAAEAVAVPVSLPAPRGAIGMVRPEDGRMLERKVDLDGDGIISETIDLDGDGKIEDGLRVIGTFEGAPVVARETGGETLRFPIVALTPSVMEPEVVAFSPDGTRAYVTLQEVNGIAVVDPAAGRVLGYLGLGTTTHAADLDDDETVAFDDVLTALREPDGLAVTPDGKHLVTADEGDTVPETDDGVTGLPGAGGRTVSVVDLTTGKVIGDTGNGLDEGAHAAGVYPDRRSDRKGCEPEMIAAFSIDGRDGVAYAVVGLERADAVALISLRDPARPRVLQVVPTGHAGSAPEGVAIHREPGSDDTYVLTANENGGTMSVFRVCRDR